MTAKADREVRLQAYLARAGVASRRRAEALITSGRVSVNNQVVTVPGCQVARGRDIVQLDGQVLEWQELMTLAFNKPRGVVTTMTDPQGRPTIADFLDANGPRVFPVGRLDYASEGLLILTNDGELARRLMHPSFGVAKVYAVKVKGHPSAEALRRLRSGVMMAPPACSRSGPPAARAPQQLSPRANVHVLETLRINTWLQIEVHEGQQHLVRRMLDAIEHPVLRLVRTAVGPLEIDDLKSGSVRRLTSRELFALRAAVKLAEGAPPRQPAVEQPGAPARSAGAPARGAERKGEGGTPGHRRRPPGQGVATHDRPRKRKDRRSR
ncbi:MAG: rRNA pseudouridine synthase [Candidatus Schekmanbacteria bacterium]|nr:rRNA pseudouridine synthase [Candidatus Schekmanbacteria bacterium]